ncbi:MAG TPA: LuxR C-terminal-related transcriptional regulator [Solirubrobacteraceae bacterium]|nr:LuxR C-terminal-related transcriptional regulator [Solirubrobacteraceae bacterium]
MQAALERAASLIDLLSITGQALEEHLGYRESALMLTLTDTRRAYAGVKHGSPEYVIEEYFECWADRDALASDAAATAFARSGWTTTTDLYRRLAKPQQTFVDDFLKRNRCPYQLSLRIPGRATDGYLTVMGHRDFGPTDRAALQQLLPALGTQLRGRLPVGLPSRDISPRERHVCELIALGFNNREIAEILHIEEDTVKKHVSRALKRLHVRRRTELAVAWMTGRRLDIAVPTPSTANGNTRP